MRRLLCSAFVLVAGTAYLAPAALAQSTTIGDVTLNLDARVYGFGDAASNQDHLYSGLEAVRLYPSIDALSSSGIKYGMFADLREGADTGPQDIRAGQIYSRRLYAYIGTDNLGTFRVGTTDGASEYNQVGTFDVGSSMFNDGGWNGIAHYALASAANPAFPFASSRYYYATNKIVYLSPRIENFNFNISYEPNVRGLNINDGGHYSADSNSDFTDAANIADDGATRRNTFDGAVRYAKSFGDVAVITTASYVLSGHADAGNSEIKYQGLNFGDLGASVSYAGFTVASNIERGKFDGSWQLSPRGAANSTAYSLGVSYKIASYSAGISYFNYRSPGVLVPGVETGSRLEQGLSAGGSYIFSKNISFYLDYLLGQRDQPGYDFLTGAEGSTAAYNARTQGIAVGGRFNW